LHSTSTAIGLLEQLGVATTVSPEEDASEIPGNSWFGAMLSGDGFSWHYLEGDAEKLTFASKDDILAAYFDGSFAFTAYNWECLYLNVKGDAGEAAGTVRIKGKTTASGTAIEHRGNYQFRCEIVRKGEGENWKLRRWVLIAPRATMPEAGGKSPAE
jgi:hypothetical protein